MKGVKIMKVTYLERGNEFDFKRIGDKYRTFDALSVFQPKGTSLHYFQVDSFNYKVIGNDDLISIDGEYKNTYAATCYLRNMQRG